MLPRIDWARVDTCCIDKTSSAELSEAINSMWRRYEQAAWCIAYLSDVDIASFDDGLGRAELRQQVESSEWFSRGWTLQELLAPQKVFFYSKQWTYLGSKGCQRSEMLRDGRYGLGLLQSVTNKTGVASPFVSGQDPVHSASIAQRMSWAAQRSTSRPEDASYCLLGLFNLNMRLLYGEGRSRAFRRLQEHILLNSNDESVFAFFTVDDNGALARKIESLNRCGVVIQVRPLDDKSSSISQQCLKLNAPAIDIGKSDMGEQRYLVRLSCVTEGDQSHLCEVQLMILKRAGHVYTRDGTGVEEIKTVTESQLQERIRSGEWQNISRMDFDIPLVFTESYVFDQEPDLGPPYLTSLSTAEDSFLSGLLRHSRPYDWNDQSLYDPFVETSYGPISPEPPGASKRWLNDLKLERAKRARRLDGVLDVEWFRTDPTGERPRMIYEEWS